MLVRTAEWIYYKIFFYIIYFSLSCCNETDEKCIRVVLQVDLRHMDEKVGSNIVDVGVDLSEFYMSVEWDILEVPAVR